jgi:hypothetical protein
MMGVHSDVGLPLARPVCVQDTTITRCARERVQWLWCHNDSPLGYCSRIGVLLHRRRAVVGHIGARLPLLQTAAMGVSSIFAVRSHIVSINGLR